MRGIKYKIARQSFLLLAFLIIFPNSFAFAQADYGGGLLAQISPVLRNIFTFSFPSVTAPASTPATSLKNFRGFFSQLPEIKPSKVTTKVGKDLMVCREVFNVDNKKCYDDFEHNPGIIALMNSCKLEGATGEGVLLCAQGKARDFRDKFSKCIEGVEQRYQNCKMLPTASEKTKPDNNIVQGVTPISPPQPPSSATPPPSTPPKPTPPKRNCQEENNTNYSNCLNANHSTIISESNKCRETIDKIVKDCEALKGSNKNKPDYGAYTNCLNKNFGRNITPDAALVSCSAGVASSAGKVLTTCIKEAGNKFRACILETRVSALKSS